MHSPTNPSRRSPSLTRRSLFGAAMASATVAAASSAAASPAAAAPRSAHPLLEGESALSRPDRIFLERGLLHGAWLRSGPEDEWFPDAELWSGSGFNAPTFYNPPLYSPEVMEAAGSPVWTLAKGPRGEHLEPPPPAEEDLLPPEAMPHVDHLFTACFGDEEAFSEDRLTWLVEYYQRMHRDHPHVLVHNNQAIGQYPDPEMRRYIAEASPDLLTFDFYYFHQAVQYDGGSVSPLYRHTGRYRRLAMEGRDGQGNDPLAFGQYTTGFKLHPPESPDGTPVYQWRELFVSESQQMVVSHATWAMGGKWLDLFRWEKGPEEESLQTDGQFLNHPDGTPTPQYYRYQRLNRTMRAYSPYLTRLRTHAIALDRGIVAETGERTPEQAEVPDFSPDTDPATGIVAITAENLGTANDGERGDVLLGTFRELPGMTTEENAGVLPDRAGTTAFMLVNTLVWRNDDWRDANGTGGDGDQTAQRITVTLDRRAVASAVGSTRSLYRVDPDSGEARPVRLAAQRGGLFACTVDLRGGESGLYFWG